MILRIIAILCSLGFLALSFSLVSSEKGRRSLVLALRSLWLHKLRSFLSILGIIIGTGAVIILMAFGEGSMQDALDDIRRMGATNLMINSVKPPDDSSTQRRTMIATYGLTYADYDRFLTIGSVIRRVPMRIFPKEIVHLDATFNGRVVATRPEYQEVNQLSLVCGRFLTDEDDHYMVNVCVLGSEGADKLFPFKDPLGESVRIEHYFYRVVGVLKDRVPLAPGGGSQAPIDFNKDVYIPLNTCKARFGEKIYTRQSGSRSGEQVQLSQVTLTVSDMEKVRPAGDVIRELLDRYHQKRDWSVTIPLDRLEEAERATTRYTMLLFVIASISLFVGGVGIMNIMLATVTERTREIGIRRALGAKRKDITLQFLIEAMAQTSLGGLAGVVLGLSFVFIVPTLWRLVIGSRLPAVVNVDSIFYSVGVSIVVGIGFGWYPARRAALLDPIEALRHE
jgi:putative ABC transport system permease protein